MRPRKVTAGPESGRWWLDVAWVALWLLGPAGIVTAAAAIGLEVWRHAQPPEELAGVPLMAAMFGVMTAARSGCTALRTRAVGSSSCSP